MASAKAATVGSRRGLALALALLLGACTSTPDSFHVSLPDAPKQAEMQPATEREHQRILASYGGVYEDAKLNDEIGTLVDRLVAASERPEPEIPGDYSQFAGDQRVRAAQRPPLRHARADRARQ